jgi:hypothetical protein
MPSNIYYSDNFHANLFAANVYELVSFAQPIIGHLTQFPHALSPGPAGQPPGSLIWQDLRLPIPSGFARARVWMDLVAQSIGGGVEGMACVGFQAKRVLNSMRPIGERPIAAATYGAPDGLFADGIHGGLVQDSSVPGFATVLQIWEQPGAGNPADAIPADAPAPFTVGHIELVLTSGGEITVTTPNGHSASTTISPITLGAWLQEHIFPSVIAYGPVYLGDWGYEYDFPVNEAGEIHPGTMKGGAVRLHTMGNPFGVPLGRVP